LTDDDGETNRRWERGERLLVDVFGQDRFENGLAWLVGSNHCGPPYLDLCEMSGGASLSWRQYPRWIVSAHSQSAPLCLPSARSGRRRAVAIGWWRDPRRGWLGPNDG